MPPSFGAAADELRGPIEDVNYEPTNPHFTAIGKPSHRKSTIANQEVAALSSEL